MSLLQKNKNISNDDQPYRMQGTRAYYEHLRTEHNLREISREYERVKNEHRDAYLRRAHPELYRKKVEIPKPEHQKHKAE